MRMVVICFKSKAYIRKNVSEPKHSEFLRMRSILYMKHVSSMFMIM